MSKTDQISVTIAQLRAQLFEDQTSKETLKTLEFTVFQFLCSDEAEDTQIRNEVIVMLRIIKNLIISVENSFTGVKEELCV